MPNKTWKQVERAIAHRIGGQRMSKAGLGEAVPDVENDWLSIEVKTRRTFPAWLEGSLEQAERNATAGKLPTVRLHKIGQRHGRDLIVLRASDFEAWFGGYMTDTVADAGADDLTIA